MLTLVLRFPTVPAASHPVHRLLMTYTCWLLHVQALPARVLNPLIPSISTALQASLILLPKVGEKSRRTALEALGAVEVLAVRSPMRFLASHRDWLPQVLDGLRCPAREVRTRNVEVLGWIVVGLYWEKDSDWEVKEREKAKDEISAALFVSLAPEILSKAY
jgi:hypothetical protein